METLTYVSFWFRMPSEGLVQAWLKARSEFSAHHGVMSDELGISEGSIDQLSSFTMKVSFTGGSAEAPRVDKGWFQIFSQTSGHWVREFLPSGSTAWAKLVSDSNVRIPAGAWVLVQVGVWNSNWAWANDVKVYSSTEYAWTIEHVAVRAVNAP
jgi:hypothetical protein